MGYEYDMIMREIREKFESLKLDMDMKMDIELGFFRIS